MNKNFKGKIGLFLTIMLITFVLSPTSFLAAERNNSKPHILYLKNMKINLNEVDNDISLKENMPNKLSENSLLEDSMNLYIVAFNGPVKDYMKNGVTKLGVELIEYVPDFAFLARIEPETLFDVLQLSYIEDVVMYLPEFKINPFFNDGIDAEEIIVKIATFDDSSILDDDILNFGGTKLDFTENEVIVKLNFNDIENFANLNSVKYIEPVIEHVLYNDKAKNYMGVNDITDSGYKGSGQVVGVCDTGLDTGVNDSSMHSDFQGRIDDIYSLGRSTADDTHGHGTHVAGSVLGSGEKSDGQHKGIAPEAHLVFQSILDSNGGLGGLPSDLNDLFEQAENSGANIHTNSWGAPVNGEYNGESQDVDEYVWNNDDMIILFAAGNDGDGKNGGTVYNSIGSPGTAKNCITVGACENYRPNMPETRWGNVGDDPDQIAPFSSRGTCEDGRTKPDIVAPGTWILSTKSSVAPDDSFWSTYNDYYAYMGGTSMSTPLTAGAVAVARQYMQEEWNHTPSAAMMKAAIINGGTNLGLGFPSRDQGWGRINLKDSLSSKEYEYIDQDYNLSTGGSENFTYSIESTNTPLRITLVWSDYPGSVTASKALVNDLDIKVTSPSGTIYYGNDFTKPYNSKYDRLNNVENVWINSPEIGDYTVKIKGYNVPQGPQPFALFSSADFGTPEIDETAPTCSITSPNDGDTVSGTMTFTANAQDNKAVKSVEFYVDNNKIGEDTEAPYSFDWNTTTTTNGNHTLQVKAIDTSDNVGTSDEITITVNNITDETAPTCIITSPTTGDTINGTIAFTADAQDNIAVKSVEFYVDNTKIGEDTEAPYSFDWNTTTVSNENHTLQVKAIDTSNNVGISDEITITVDNTSTVNYKTETFTGRASIFRSPTTNINVTANGTMDIELTGNSSLEMKLYDPNDQLVSSGSTTISYDAAETGTYSIVVSAFSLFGTNYTLKATYPVTSNTSEIKKDIKEDVVEQPDNAILPTDTLTKIINDGDIIKDTITINTQIDDNTPINVVELYIDNNKVNEYPEIPHTIEWDTTTVANGNHTIQVKIIDTSGNIITSNEINITIDNNVDNETKVIDENNLDTKNEVIEDTTTTKENEIPEDTNLNNESEIIEKEDLDDKNDNIIETTPEDEEETIKEDTEEDENATDEEDNSDKKDEVTEKDNSDNEDKVVDDNTPENSDEVIVDDTTDDVVEP
jgi:subtilase family protein/Big-like domain-containing protein